jgi:nucleotide-binding universal stress UspA family protein
MKTILVGIDPSDSSNQALLWAIENANDDDKIIATHAWQIHPIAGLEMPIDNPAHLEVEAFKLVQSAITDVLQAVPDGQEVADVSVKTVHGHPSKTLVDMSEDVDLLVVGSRGQGGFRGLLLGSVSTYLVQHSRCPVVVVPPN